MQYPSGTQVPAPPSAPLFDGSQACAGAEIDLFFPPVGGTAPASIELAKQLCAGCPFRTPCLEYALTAQGSSGVYVDGVWGGTTARERMALRNGHGRVRHLRAAS